MGDERMKNKKKYPDRFRFRAWDKQPKKMYYDVQDLQGFLGLDAKIDKNIGMYDTFGQLLSEPLNFSNESMFEIMQCTGIRDKNNKLIYEGDLIHTIIKTLGGNKIVDKIEIIKYYDSACQFSAYYTFIGSKTLINDEIEIIGNIYENSELLENINR